jgi:Flp pilus assembly pilin Flp
MLSLYTDLEVRVREFASKAARRDEGAGIVEYLLLVVFIALVMIVALAFFTGRLGTAFSRAGNSLQ